MKKMNLQLFSGGHSVTVVADGGFTAASASASSDVQKNADVTLTLTPDTGKEIDSVEVFAGGVTLTVTDGVYGFKMGEENVTIVASSKGSNIYKIVENRDVWINGAKTHLQRNMSLVKGNNGAITGVTCEGTAITLGADIVADLVKEGVIVKI